MLSFQDPLASLSADMIARTYNIFSIILKYAVDMLTWDKEDELPLGLEPPYVHTHHTPEDDALTIYLFSLYRSIQLMQQLLFVCIFVFPRTGSVETPITACCLTMRCTLTNRSSTHYRKL